MQRSLPLAVLFVLALIAGVAFWLLGQEATPPPPPPIDLPAASTPAPVDAAATRTEPTRGTNDDPARREAGGPVEFDVTDDPEIRAGLTGFRGRVVDHRQQPVAGCGVRLYRGAMDSMLPAGIDPMADESSWAPDYLAGEVRTDEAGKFLIDRVWPRAFYLLLAGIGTDAPHHRFLQETPEPGQIVDLGDIVLDPLAVATGTVVNEDGDPIAGALVRAVDLPGQMVSIVPFERFDPAGCIFVRERSAPFQVIELPAWVERAFEHLPIPATRTDAAGKFRLVGIVPGNNYVAATHPERLAEVKPTVKFEPGETKDLGALRLRDGEDLSVRVVDGAGKPIAGAEVVAAATTAIAPVDFARRIGVTDAEGRADATGFPAGKATVAARRGPRDPWVLAEPQPILNDIVVTLPAMATLTVRVTAAGVVVREPKLRLLPSKGREEAFVLATVGFQRPVDLGKRLRHLEDGQIAIDDLPTGRYLVMATAEGMTMASVDVDLTNGAASAQIDLKPGKSLTVRVLGPKDVPIRNAAIFVQDRVAGRGEMPYRAGRTDAEGVLRVTTVSGERLRVSAEHPKWGVMHGRPEQGQQEIVLRMELPGWMDGVVTDAGKPPAPGKYAVATEYRSKAGRGATEAVPLLATPGIDGKFALRALQPGTYRVNLFPSAAGVHSPGGVFSLVQSVMSANDLAHAEVEVVSGQGATVALDASGALSSGPVASISGTVQIDGRLAAGSRMQSWGNGRNRVAEVDASGRFELTNLPVGPVHLQLQASGSGLFERRSLWSRQLELKDGEHRMVDVVVLTTSIRGIILRSDGTPASGVGIQASCRPLQDGEEGVGGTWSHVNADAEGRFHFDQVAAGIYSLTVQPDESEGQRGELKEVRAEGGRPVDGLEIRMRATVEFRGRVDLSVLQTTPEWCWMTVHRINPKDPTNHWAGEQVDGITVAKDGTFSSRGLDPGTFNFVVHANVGDQWQQLYPAEPITIGPGGARDVVLRVHPREPNQKK